MLKKSQIYILIVCALAGFIFALIFLFLNSNISFNKTQEKNQIKTVLDNYFKAWESADPEAMYNYISVEDKKLTTLADYKNQFAEFPVQPAGHELKSIVVSLPLAKADLLVAWPDFSTGKNIQREEIFYLTKEGAKWKVREAVSLEK